MNFKSIHRTLRFCVVCERNMLFQYNKRIGHSECIRCGGRFAKAYRDGNALKDLQQYIEQRFIKLRSELDKAKKNRDEELVQKIKVRRNELNKLRQHFYQELSELLEIQVVEEIRTRRKASEGVAFSSYETQVGGGT